MEQVSHEQIDALEAGLGRQVDGRLRREVQTQSAGIEAGEQGDSPFVGNAFALGERTGCFCVAAAVSAAPV